MIPVHQSQKGPRRRRPFTRSVFVSCRDLCHALWRKLADSARQHQGQGSPDQTTSPSSAWSRAVGVGCGRGSWGLEQPSLSPRQGQLEGLGHHHISVWPFLAGVMGGLPTDATHNPQGLHSHSTRNKRPFHVVLQPYSKPACDGDTLKGHLPATQNRARSLLAGQSPGQTASAAVRMGVGTILPELIPNVTQAADSSS
uniref:Uncharacterized protein n=1 Tax=Myotis myotis TaxID=51298 RepID=A0A7J7WI95_MYOMY|nr:hypothetical protein mMyoMyo1_012147 [Myotis myotis]